jgi:hypothetical protein
MDCRTARLLLLFHRPGTGELDGLDRAALDSHLTGCLDCAVLASAERATDERLGRAMRQVEVPAGLRDRILARLAVERGDWYRRWYGRWARYAVAAALLILVGWGAWAFYPRHRPALDLRELLEQTNQVRPGPAEVSESWKRLGVPALAPECFKTAFLIGHGVAELPGHPSIRVPFLAFASGEKRPAANQAAPASGVYDFALVYVVSDKQFDLQSLVNPPSDKGYHYRLMVLGPRGSEYVQGEEVGYLVFYTGDISWLLEKQESES